MVIFTLSQSVWEFAKSRAICSMGASMVYVPTCQTRISFPFYVPVKALTCQRCAYFKTCCVNVRKACQVFNFACQKAYQFFNYFSDEFFNFWIYQSCSVFANLKNIWPVLEKLSRQTKKLSFDICKISWRKNLANLKPLTSFSIEHVGLTKKLFG